MGTGTISELDLVYTVLSLVELEDFMEVITCIVVFVINLHVHSGTVDNHPKKGKGSSKDRGADGAPTARCGRVH